MGGGCDQSGDNMPGRMQGPHEDVGLSSASTQGACQNKQSDAALVHTERPQRVGRSPCAFSAGEAGRAGETRPQIESRCGLGALRDGLSPGEPGEVVALQAFLSCP